MQFLNFNLCSDASAPSVGLGIKQNMAPSIGEKQKEVIFKFCDIF